MPNAKIYPDASHVESAPDEVMVSGPDGVAVSMTPEAATETGGRMIEQAAEARGKQAIEADAQRRRANHPQ